MLRLAVLSFALALLGPRAAHACSCVPPRLARTVLPADGADGFPTDGILRVFLTGGFPAQQRGALAAEYRLRDDRGALVQLGSSVVETRLDLRPAAPLRPSTRYTLESVFAYDAAGMRISDTERLRAAGAMRGAWFAVASFRTGAGPSGGRAIQPQITGAEVHFAMGGGDCGPAMGVTAAVQLPATLVATDVLELRIEGIGVVKTMPALGTTRVMAGDFLCDPDPVSLPARRPLRVELAVLDASGRELGVSALARAQGRPRRPLPPRWEQWRRGSQPSVATPWPALTIGPARPIASPGPAHCPHGLEIVARQEIASMRAPWTFEDHSSLTANGNAAWMALSDGTAMHVLSVAPNAATPLRSVPGALARIGASSANGPSFVAFTYATSTPAATLHALHPDGRERWTQLLQGHGYFYRVEAGTDRILASWLERTAPLARRVAWALFDARTGAPIGSRSVTAHTSGSNGGLASARVNDHFLLAFPSPNDTTSVLVLSRDGAELARRELTGADGPLDLASAGGRAALVMHSEGEIAWQLLDDSARSVRGPVIVSSGIGGRDNRKPRIAWNGEVYAVAWETHPAGRTYVSVVDPEGRVAPALALDPDRHSCTVGLAPMGRDFLMSYTVDPYETARPIVGALRCRTTPPVGAPQRIQP